MQSVVEIIRKVRAIFCHKRTLLILHINAVEKRGISKIV